MRNVRRKHVALGLLCLMVAASVYAASLRPTREAFFSELLNPQPTPRTSRFDDYTPGSYHVNKYDVWKGLPNAARKQNKPLRGLLIVGPSGPLWTYHVFTFIEENKKIRTNLLVMPHARITHKATLLISPARYDEFIKEILQTQVLAARPPSKDKEWDIAFLLDIRTEKGKVRVYSGGDLKALMGLKEDRRQLKLLEKIDAFSKHMKATYQV